MANQLIDALFPIPDGLDPAKKAAVDLIHNAATRMAKTIAAGVPRSADQETALGCLRATYFFSLMAITRAVSAEPELRVVQEETEAPPSARVREVAESASDFNSKLEGFGLHRGV